jgi:hypothetical protein
LKFQTIDLFSQRYVNGGNSDCSCFIESPPVGSNNNKLVPYVSIGRK